ncbi:MAG TPA: hypothetical protein GXZ90_02005 [Clostridiales bacterium]|nr:hypothetical protein [Clostridiales bacterium]
MKIANKYFEAIQNKGEIYFMQVNDFVKEFTKSCKAKGIKVKIIQYEDFVKVVKVNSHRFYIQRIEFDTGVWKWKLYAKAESYEEAIKKINHKMYSSCGDKIFRILDRFENKYY